MRRYAVISTTAAPPRESPFGEGLRVGVIVDRSRGSVHMQVAECVLEAGGSIGGHFHAYEESFFILAGEVLLRLSGQSHRLQAGDFGVAPVGVPHAWRNASVERAFWLRMRAPQPRQLGGSPDGTFTAPDIVPPDGADVLDPANPRTRHLGHFDDDQLPAPGPIAVRGVNAYHVRNVSVRLMVDDTVGARHHVMFAGQMVPGITDTPPPHYHPFEEVYYFRDGRARALLDGDEHEVAVGDVVFAGVNASHAFVPLGDAPLRWIETQAPRPPEQDSMFLEGRWSGLEPVR
jgi:quercetin dioxygenase-like cupin family protein